MILSIIAIAVLGGLFFAWRAGWGARVEAPVVEEAATTTEPSVLVNGSSTGGGFTVETEAPREQPKEETYKNSVDECIGRKLAAGETDANAIFLACLGENPNAGR